MLFVQQIVFFLFAGCYVGKAPLCSYREQNEEDLPTEVFCIMMGTVAEDFSYLSHNKAWYVSIEHKCFSENESTFLGKGNEIANS